MTRDVYVEINLCRHQYGTSWMCHTWPIYQTDGRTDRLSISQTDTQAGRQTYTERERVIEIQYITICFYVCPHTPFGKHAILLECACSDMCTCSRINKPRHKQSVLFAITIELLNNQLRTLSDRVILIVVLTRMGYAALCKCITHLAFLSPHNLWRLPCDWMWITQNSKNSLDDSLRQDRQATSQTSSSSLLIFVPRGCNLDCFVFR